MNETIFIQFYSRIENTNPKYKGQSMYEVCNGFSETLDLCKSKGDMLWVNFTKQQKTYGKNVTNEFEYTLPINKGTIYVSVFYFSQLDLVFNWARENPNIKFVTGGPASNPRTYILKSPIIPPNLFIMDCTVEEYFGVPNFSHKWKLELPNEDHSMTLLYTYFLRSTCYWGKCIFCNFSQGARCRPSYGFEFLDVQYTGFQRICLYSPSVNHNELKIIFENIPYSENIRYDIFIRGNKREKDALKQIIENKKNRLPQVKFMIGVDFASSRMLKYINKNILLDEVIEVLDVIAMFNKEDTQVQLSFIVGWGNLTQQDVEETREFISKLPYDKVKFTFGLSMLSARPHTFVYDNFQKKSDLVNGNFIYGFMPVVSQEQIELSKQVAHILYEPGVTVFDYYNVREI